MNELRFSSGIGASKSYPSTSKPKYSSDEFTSLVKSTIQISSKNRILQSRNK